MMRNDSSGQWTWSNGRWYYNVLFVIRPAMDDHRPHQHVKAEPYYRKYARKPDKRY